MIENVLELLSLVLFFAFFTVTGAFACAMVAPIPELTSYYFALDAFFGFVSTAAGLLITAIFE